MESKKWYRSRTIWIAGIQAIAGILVAVTTEYPELDAVGMLAVVKSAVDIVLRYITVQPID